MNTVEIESIIRDVLKDMTNGNKSVSTASASSVSGGGATVADYPIAQKHPEWLRSESGKNFEEITLDNVLAGKIEPKDLRITPSVLKAQGEIASSAGRKTIANNFSRAAELTAVPDERVLSIYNALRPYRSSKQELLDIANELETKYNAVICASFVREAAGHYETRKKLKGDN